MAIRLLLIIIAPLIWVLGTSGCIRRPEVLPPEKRVSFLPVKVPHTLVRKLSFTDNGSRESLELAITRSIEYYSRLPEGRIMEIAGLEFSAGSYKRALTSFLEMLREGDIGTENILRVFDLYTYCSREEEFCGRMLITGYYEPIIEGSYKKDETYRFPVYPQPDDLLRVNLPEFGITCSNRPVLFGRAFNGKLVPYFTRKEIDEGALRKLTPLFWARDPVELFFLHIQGSGVVAFPDGSSRRVGYAASNGRPYRSIGKYMIEKGYIPEEGMSMQAIRDFLLQNRDIMWEILWHNESYVFFRWVEEGPQGSLGVVLTPERSVASDRRFYPAGILSYLSTVVPRRNGTAVSFNKWVLHQDTGGAIKGPFRLDLFFGTGSEAGNLAGKMKHQGTLFFLLPRNAHM
ncbi:murein transglycosylase A [Thermodesulforhabdus norvegica]|uniref:peptidoglycan lytic exotransglycosylase n=1 Tax=Thermodesulforhabdus norvegica TaxID=39841 RepID=A0A1I4W096_9BACT|nr:MltA domain-containing protein [Thermodesulforhabdus norvegica]SFN06559.1 membrane-bound lytic murein transglycosylase A [Thermodesulforhabdus norvegica]